MLDIPISIEGHPVALVVHAASIVDPNVEQRITFPLKLSPGLHRLAAPFSKVEQSLLLYIDL